VLIEMLEGHPLAAILHSWRSYTAKQANKILGRQGKFWANDYFDRYIRDRDHFVKATTYIRENPVKAGLATRAEDWPFSSARFSC